MTVIRLCLNRLRHPQACLSSQVIPAAFRRNKSSLPSQCTLGQVDDHDIPIQPTWSVNDLLASYPRPIISSDVLERIHVLSSLVPPEKGTVERQRLTEELESLVKLVEAVKLGTAATGETRRDGIPDGRVWAPEMGIDLSYKSQGLKGVPCDMGIGGRALLKHATRTANGLYVIEADKHRSSGL